VYCTRARTLGITHFCGGSILSADWVVTAAHCCAGQIPATMHVVAGGIKLDRPEGEEERVNVAKIIGHPDYNSRDLTNDICLLKATFFFLFSYIYLFVPVLFIVVQSAFVFFHLNF
jgi:secreted trypsin-like serine protease